MGDLAAFENDVRNTVDPELAMLGWTFGRMGCVRGTKDLGHSMAQINFAYTKPNCPMKNQIEQDMRAFAQARGFTDLVVVEEVWRRSFADPDIQAQLPVAAEKAGLPHLTATVR